MDLCKHLEKYDQLKTYVRQGELCYIDVISKQYRPATPEECVRQKILLWLLNEIKVPKEMIVVEESMAHYQKGNNDRADICIFAESQDGYLDVLMIIECKKEGIPLNDDVYEQATKYAEITDCPLVGMTNGQDILVYKYDYNQDVYNLLAEIPTYSKLLECDALATEAYVSLGYVPYYNDVASIENINNELVADGIMGEDTPVRMTEPIVKLYDYIMDESNDLSNIVLGMEYRCLSDNGRRDTSFGNAGGGSWDGVYRTFVIENSKSKDTQIVSIGIMGSMKTTNDKRFGNRKGHTTLLVAIDDYKKKHNSLQLNIDESLSMGKDAWIFTHNGKLSAGNKGSVSPTTVRDFMKRNTNFEVGLTNIVLGRIRFDENHECDEISLKQFIGNLILYALKRDDLRKVMASK